MSKSVSFYLVLFLVIGPFYAAAPLAWAFVVYALWTGKVWTYPLPWKSLFLWALLEVVFSVYYDILARHVTATPPRPPPDFGLLQTIFTRVVKVGMANLPVYDDDGASGDEQDQKERGTIERIGSPVEDVVELNYHDPRAQDFRERMRTWFYKKPWSDIHKHELRQWIYWSIFNAHLPSESEIPAVHKAAMDNALAMVEKRAGTPVKPGSNPTCKPLLLTLDAVNVLSRPLIYYVFVWAANYWTKSLLQGEWDLKYRRCGDLEYLVRLPQGINSTLNPRPLVVLHGLGLGLFQYNLLLTHLLDALPSRPILIPLQPHTSQDIFHPRFLDPLPREESVRCLTEAILQLGWGDRGVDILSHSNGSFFHAWMLKSYPGLIKRSCFVDPVTFCSWEGDLCYNFVYKPCRSMIELITYYFVGTELGVANVIQRHFDWSSNSLWFEEIPHATDPRKAAFFFGGRDAIIDAARVKRYLQSHGVRKGLWFDPNGRHGQALMAGGEGLKKITEWLLDDD